MVDIIGKIVFFMLFSANFKKHSFYNIFIEIQSFFRHFKQFSSHFYKNFKSFGAILFTLNRFFRTYIFTIFIVSKHQYFLKHFNIFSKFLKKFYNIWSSFNAIWYDFIDFFIDFYFISIIFLVFWTIFNTFLKKSEGSTYFKQFYPSHNFQKDNIFFYNLKNFFILILSNFDVILSNYGRIEIFFIFNNFIFFNRNDCRRLCFGQDNKKFGNTKSLCSMF